MAQLPSSMAVLGSRGAPTVAPKSMKIAGAMNAGFQNHWTTVSPAEQLRAGRHACVECEGQMEMILPETGVSGSVSTTTLSPALNCSGSFHYPPVEPRGGHTDVSFSGGDFPRWINCNEQFACVQSGAKQFMMARRRRRQ